MILDEIGNHVTPAQALAAVWIFVGFFTGKAVHLGAEYLWCSLTGREIRPCGCRHCASVRLAATQRADNRDATVIPIATRKREAA